MITGVALLVVVTHLPYDIHLSFVPNGYGVKYRVVS